MEFNFDPTELNRQSEGESFLHAVIHFVVSLHGFIKKCRDVVKKSEGAKAKHKDKKRAVDELSDSKLDLDKQLRDWAAWAALRFAPDKPTLGRALHIRDDADGKSSR